MLAASELDLGVLHKEVSPQYKVEGLSVHHIEPMGDSWGAHRYLHFTVSAAVHHMSIPHWYSRGGHGFSSGSHKVIFPLPL